MEAVLKMRVFEDGVFFEGLQEVMLGDGPHTFRVIFDPEKFKGQFETDIQVVNPSGDLLKISVERWGRKTKISFCLPPESPEGVFRVVVRSPKMVDKSRKFWVIR